MRVRLEDIAAGVSAGLLFRLARSRRGPRRLLGPGPDGRARFDLLIGDRGEAFGGRRRRLASLDLSRLRPGSSELGEQVAGDAAGAERQKRGRTQGGAGSGRPGSAARGGRGGAGSRTVWRLRAELGQAVWNRVRPLQERGELAELSGGFPVSAIPRELSLGTDQGVGLETGSVRQLLGKERAQPLPAVEPPVSHLADYLRTLAGCQG